MASPERELSTTSTPSPPVRRSTSSAKASVRESITCGMPSERSSSRFSAVPAVANTSAPRRLGASAPPRGPSPPAAEWMRTRSPRSSRARWYSAYQAVMKTLGMALASAALSPGGRRTAKRASVTTCEAMAEGAKATTSSPTARSVTPAPTATTRPAQSRPSGRPASGTPEARPASFIT